MDKILEKFFEMPRWTYALRKGLDKNIRKDQIYKLTKPEVRASLYSLMKDGKYKIAPPHTALIPKDTPGEYRTVFICEPLDRVVLSITNDLLFELCNDMVHPACTSYQKGIGCGKVVQEISHRLMSYDGEKIGWKADLSKYFDSVPVEFIDGIFDKVEKKTGKSAVIDILRDYYHSDIYFDEHGEVRQAYQSLKQGCAPASFLADALLYHIDEQLSRLDGYYVRYSDDILFIGKDASKAMDILSAELARMRLTLNPKKVEPISRNRWFKFLGFSIKGDSISLSSTRIKTFQKEIRLRTVSDRTNTLRRSVNAVNKYLYKGDGTHSWATQVLSIVNVRKDIDTLNTFVMDALRAVQTKRRKIGGLGYVATQKEGCIARGRGQNVTSNRQRTDETIDGYYTLACMQNALKTRKAVYKTLVNSL